MYLNEIILKSIISDAKLINGDLNSDLFFEVDSRKLKQNNLFFALPGQNVDGHDYLIDAFLKCEGIVILESKRSILESFDKSIFKNKIIILVENVLDSLIKLAFYARDQFEKPLVAITGSLGKTSSKLFTHHILIENNFKSFASHENQNTLIGVCINLSYLNSQYDCAIFEVGISKKGEMQKIAEILRPTVAVVTTISNSHLQDLENLHQIASEKCKLIDNLKPNGTVILNGDVELLNDYGNAFKKIRFGKENFNEIIYENIVSNKAHISFVLKFKQDSINIDLPYLNKANLANSVVAASISLELGLNLFQIKKTLEIQFERKRRFELCKLKNFNGIIIDDGYNASFESMKAAIEAFDLMNFKGKKIAVLADMLGLSNKTEIAHENIIKLLNSTFSINRVILIGQFMLAASLIIKLSIKNDRFFCLDDAIEEIENIIEDDIMILVKGSNGMNLFKIISKFAI